MSACGEFKNELIAGTRVSLPAEYLNGSLPGGQLLERSIEYAGTCGCGRTPEAAVPRWLRDPPVRAVEAAAPAAASMP
jgi:hypothetical protein